jgi:hypothetical protein
MTKQISLVLRADDLRRLINAPKDAEVVIQGDYHPSRAGDVATPGLVKVIWIEQTQTPDPKR